MIKRTTVSTLRIFIFMPFFVLGFGCDSDSDTKPPPDTLPIVEPGSEEQGHDNEADCEEPQSAEEVITGDAINDLLVSVVLNPDQPEVKLLIRQAQIGRLTCKS